MTTDHTVQAGDTLESIAEQYGFFSVTLWEHADNATLREKRPDPNVLAEGDVVKIPKKVAKQIGAACEAKHRFKRNGVPAKLRMQFLDGYAPRAKVPFRLEIDGKSKEGKTDDEGFIDVSVPPSAQRAVLFLGPTGHEERYELQIGHLDPIDTPRGVKSRLNALGFYSGDPDSTSMDDEQTIEAISAFQRFIALEPTGELDDDTRKALMDLHDANAEP